MGIQRNKFRHLTNYYAYFSKVLAKIANALSNLLIFNSGYVMKLP